jgi:purine-nucleoside phosphorylase
MTAHINAKAGEIKETVIMPGDPKRAEMIANNFLTDVKVVSDVRGIKAYTGKYNNTELTVMASGMGNPSMGIYSYELYKFYNVKNIIRIGTCGAYSKDLNPFDVVLMSHSYSKSNFAYEQSGYDNNMMEASPYLNNKIIDTATKLNIPLTVGVIECSDVYYKENDNFEEVLKTTGSLGVEMESFALFNNARVLNKNAACILTISNSLVTGVELTPEERQNALLRMIELALKSAED